MRMILHDNGCLDELWGLSFKRPLPKCLIKGLGVGEVGILKESVAAMATLNIVMFTPSMQIVVIFFFIRQVSET